MVVPQALAVPQLLTGSTAAVQQFVFVTGAASCFGAQQLVLATGAASCFGVQQLLVGFASAFGVSPQLVPQLELSAAS